jgi:hypothetical protein
MKKILLNISDDIWKQGFLRCRKNEQNFLKYFKMVQGNFISIILSNKVASWTIHCFVASLKKND